MNWGRGEDDEVGSLMHYGNEYVKRDDWVVRLLVPRAKYCKSSALTKMNTKEEKSINTHNVDICRAFRCRRHFTLHLLLPKESACKHHKRECSTSSLDYFDVQRNR
jgi:hypothetical protein